MWLGWHAGNNTAIGAALNHSGLASAGLTVTAAAISPSPQLLVTLQGGGAPECQPEKVVYSWYFGTLVQGNQVVSHWQPQQSYWLTPLLII